MTPPPGSRWSWLQDPSRRWYWYSAAALLYFATLSFPIPELSLQGHQALAVFMVAAFLWGTNTLPLPVTGLLVLFLLPVSGAMPAERVYGYFGNHALFFILGAFVLASPVTRSGLSSRLALKMVNRFGRSERSLVGSMLLLSSAMSCFISEHAVAAMLYPVALEVTRAAGGRPGGSFGLKLFLALGWGAVIGGTATLLGGARAPLALGLLEAATGQTFSFLEWTAAAAPSAAVLLALAFLSLARGKAEEGVSVEAAHRHLEERSSKLGAISRREVLTAAVLGLTVVLWVVGGHEWGLDRIALLGVLLAFLLGIARWSEVEEDVNWGIIVMYGGAIALSAAMADTGAAGVLSAHLFEGLSWSPLAAFVVMVLLSAVLTEAMSNTAAVAVLMPVFLAAAATAGLDPSQIALGTALPAGLAFLLPVSTPAIAIVISSGYVSVGEAFRRGLLLKFGGILAIILTKVLLWPLVVVGGTG